MSYIDTSGIHYSWMPHIRPALEENLPRLQEELGTDYLPPAEDVFAAFSLPLDQVRVLIVGQDPYPTPGHAMVWPFPPGQACQRRARCRISTPSLATT